MAQITWKNIDTPSMGGSMQGLESAARLFEGAMGNFQKIASNRKADAIADSAELDKQGKVYLEDQMAQFGSAEDVAKAREDGTFDAVFAGMSTDAQLSSRGALEDRTDKLVEADYRAKQEVRTENQEKRNQSAEVRAVAKAAQDAIKFKEWENEVAVLKSDRAIVSEAAEKLHPDNQRKYVQGLKAESHERHFPLEKYAHYYDADGKLDINKLNATEAAALESDYEAIKQTASQREMEALSIGGQIVNADIQAQFKTLSDSHLRLTTEGSAIDQRAKLAEKLQLRMTMGATNNPFINSDIEKAKTGGATLTSILADDPTVLKMLGSGNRHVSTGIRDMLSTEKININGVDIPLTSDMLKVALAATSENDWTSLGRFDFEELVRASITKQIGTDPNSPTIRQQYDNYRAGATEIDQKYGNDLYGGIEGDLSRLRNQREIAKENATKIADGTASPEQLIDNFTNGFYLNGGSRNTSSTELVTMLDKVAPGFAENAESRMKKMTADDVEDITKELIKMNKASIHGVSRDLHEIKLRGLLNRADQRR